MNKRFFETLYTWPKKYITDTELNIVLDKSDASRYALIHRALKEGSLSHIRRGLFLVSLGAKDRLVDLFELAEIIYGPSFISLESALAYHRLIPEAVYVTTSVTTKRAKEFPSPLGVFSYQKVPTTHFLLGVDRVVTDSGCFFLAAPWRAIADLIFTQKKRWCCKDEMCDELRIEDKDLLEKERVFLEVLVKEYPDRFTRKVLKALLV